MLAQGRAESRELEAMQFQPGDKVSLKSDLLPMTVKSVDPDGRVVCEWSEGIEIKTHTFPANSLKLRGTAVRRNGP
jgi:uncharacterized protein YodC (DUF2158 family)